MLKNVLILLGGLFILTNIGVVNLSLDPMKLFMLGVGVVFIKMMGKGLTIVKAIVIGSVLLMVYSSLFGSF